MKHSYFALEGYTSISSSSEEQLRAAKVQSFQAVLLLPRDISLRMRANSVRVRHDRHMSVIFTYGSVGSCM